jgi:hypothetical protein
MVSIYKFTHVLLLSDEDHKDQKDVYEKAYYDDKCLCIHYQG